MGRKQEVNANRLKDEVYQALKLEARERFKKLKQLGYEALNHFKSSKNPSAEELKNYIEIFKVVAKVPAISHPFNAAIAKAMSKYLTLIGCNNVPVLFKKSTTIYLHSATIAIGDKAFAIDHVNGLLPSYEELINRGQCYFFGTGSDGDFNIQVRIVEAPEPVLTAKEYKNIVCASPVVILNFPTGKVAVCDGEIHKDIPKEPDFEFDIVPGYYKCQVFIFKFTNDYSYYIILSKTDEAKKNSETEILTLQPLE